MHKVDKDNIMAELKTAVDVALLKPKAMQAVAADKTKIQYAFGILAVAAVASGLGMKFFGGFLNPGWGYILGMMVYQVIFAIIGIYVMSIVAKSIFKGHAKHDEFFRVLAFGMIVTWLAIFPPLSIVGGIWGLVILFVVLKTIHKLTTGGAIGTILVTIVAMALVIKILSLVFGMLGIGNFGYGGMKFGGNAGSMNPYSDGFKMNIDSEDGEGSVEMKDGKMVIEGPDGEKMEISIPNYN